MLRRVLLTFLLPVLSSAEASGVCSSSLELQTASEAAARYASVSRLAPDLRVGYQNAAASWLVVPAFVPIFRILLVNKSDLWSVELRSIDMEGPPKKDMPPHTLSTTTKVISISPRRAKRLIATWHQASRYPLGGDTRQDILDGTGFLLGVGDNWVHTYSPSCGIPKALVNTEEALFAVIKASSEKQRSEEWAHLEALLDDVERQLTSETNKN